MGTKKDPQGHWEGVYQKREVDQVSWYTPHLERSVALIQQAGLPPGARIIDVGAGAATLTDDLLELGYTDLTVLDISQSAIDAARSRLEERAEQVSWIVADVTTAELPEQGFDLWHDRAVFHFLTEEAARERYVQQVLRSVKPGGHVIVATFGLEGPERCSGLEVVRYDPDGIHRTFGDRFTKVGSETETHVTPWGSEQEFVYCYCLRNR